MVNRTHQVFTTTLDRRLQAAANLEVHSQRLQPALRVKTYWDSLTDEQRDELLTVDLRSLHIKAARVSGDAKPCEVNAEGLI